MARISVQEIIRKKSKQKITMLSTYDFPFGKLADESKTDIILIGDSLGMVSLGYDSTLPVTMEEMLHHTRAVARAVKQALIIADMPFRSYENADAAIKNAKKFLEAGAQGVKLEGGKKIIESIKALVTAKIPVMGHLGMLPQSVKELGGYKVQGRNDKEAARILEEARLLENAGVFSIVLECVPHELAKEVTEAVKIPTIGIGAGPETDGQVLVLHDLLGFKSGVSPKFVRKYADLDHTIREAISKFKSDVETKKFPTLKESFE